MYSLSVHITLRHKFDLNLSATVDIYFEANKYQLSTNKSKNSAELKTADTVYINIYLSLIAV